MAGKFFKLFLTLLIGMTVIFFDFNFCYAEDLKFIDARDNLGYYIDSDSVQIKNSDIFSVNFIVINADSNIMELTDLELNHTQKLYTIKSVRTLSYSDRTEISSDYKSRPPRSYSDKSLMAEIVNIILYGGE